MAIGNQIASGTAKKIITYDLDGNENGYLIELSKIGRKTTAYLTVAYPGCFKGYHLHKVRESNYTVIKGKVKVILWTTYRKEEYSLLTNDKLHIPINVPTGIKNESDDEVWLVNFPDPPYDPLLKDEQIDFNEESVQEWVSLQKKKFK